jgi:manganese transport protein
MNKVSSSDISLSEVHGSVDTTKPGKGFKKILAFIGPAYLVSVGYMDPGNWATDLAGGSKFGYSLIWVLLMSNLMALLLQGLSARLGIVRGRDLAQANRELYPRFINLPLYILAEIAIAATDLAEVLGMAIGIHLLTGIPLIYGVLFTVLDTLLLLMLQRLGMRKMESFIIALVAIIGLSFLAEMIFAKPDLSQVVTGFIPHIENDEALYIAIGIIGATVMPHNLYLHSALVQTRKFKRDEQGIRHALKMNMIDSTIALNLAFFVNAAILILAASVFFKSGRTEVAEIQEAHRLLAPLLGTSVAPVLFAVALIAAGQSSTITGTLAGQIVMEGYLRLRINPWIRRLLTRLLAITPAVVVILIYGDSEVNYLLILSQVILSLQLGFAIIPLIHFVSDKTTMKQYAIKPLTKVLAWVITIILVYLNLRMVFGQMIDYMTTPNPLIWKIVMVTGAVSLLALLALITVFPFFKRRLAASNLIIHPDASNLDQLSIPEFKKVAVALDFRTADEKVIAFALGQGKETTEYLLIHVVESASSSMLGETTGDLESIKDEEKLQSYISQLRKRGYKVSGQLGYDKRREEIIRIVRQTNADLLVMGAHGHAGMKDIIFGATINHVRHELKIPVLVVNL